MEGKIKTTDMKVNWYVYIIMILPSIALVLLLFSLIQTSLGCLPFHDFALNQDTQVSICSKVVLTCNKILVYMFALVRFYRKYFGLQQGCQDVST